VLAVNFFNRVALILSVFLVPALTQAAGMDPIIDPKCVRDQLRGYLEEHIQRPRRISERFEDLKQRCKARKIALCSKRTWQDRLENEDQKYDLLHAVAQLDDTAMLGDQKMSELLLKTFPKESDAHLQRLTRYAQERARICKPPSYPPICASDRWELVFEDYLGRTGAYPNARLLRRWSEDHIEDRIPGLKEFLVEHVRFLEKPENMERYIDLLGKPTTGQTVSIISEQSMKKRWNDVYKVFSDALGDIYIQNFRTRLEHELKLLGLPMPDAASVDFKLDRILAVLKPGMENEAESFDFAARLAANDARTKVMNLMEFNFPELMYVADTYDGWFNTTTFSRPGYSPRLNEALASFKNRISRVGANLDNSYALEEFILTTRMFFQRSDRLLASDRARSWPLLKAGVIESSGYFTRKTAELIRKLKPDQRLKDVVRDVFHVELSDPQEALLIDQWNKQDLLSLPLLTHDQMPPVPKGVAVLGGDGIGGGAIDGWTKASALMHFRKAIESAKTQDERVKVVYNALVEADSNAALIIRSAPRLLKNAIEALPKTIREHVGIKNINTSADDLKAVLENLRSLSPEDRHQFYRQLVKSISQQEVTVKLSMNGTPKGVKIGPEILRAFLGFDSAIAEATEAFIKPLEERLALAKHLGPNWRKKYSNIAFLPVKDDGPVAKLYVAGSTMDADFRYQLKDAIQHSIRDPGNLDVIFVWK
jgi:hypothetical protein